MTKNDNTEKEKNLGGRPTLYRDDFPQRAYEFLKEKACRGFTSLAAHLKVCERDIYNWRKKYPEFKTACETGMAISKALFVEEAYDNIVSTKDRNYNSPLFVRLSALVYRDSETAPVQIEGWEEAKTINEKRALILRDVGTGLITAEQAEKLSNVLVKTLEAQKVEELDERLKRMENLNAGSA